MGLWIRTTDIGTKRISFPKYVIKKENIRKVNVITFQY